MSLTSIKELCTPINSINWDQHESNSFEYLDISSIDRESKKIITTTTTLKAEAPSRARQPVIVADILVSTVRPNLNAVAIVESTYDKSIASTGFCVLRPKKDQIDPYFLFYFARSKRFVDQLVKLATGASYPAVSDKIVKSLKISLPPLETQKLIVELLDKAQALIDKRKEQIALMDQLIQSLFYDMFGDPVTNPKGWEVKGFGDHIEYLGDIGSNGSNKTVAANLAMSNQEDYAIMIRTVNLNANNFTENLKYVSKETYEFFSKSKIFGGEIIMNKIGSAGEFWLMPKLNKPVSLGLNQFMIRLENLSTKYVVSFLSTNFSKQNIKSKIRGAATKSITKAAVRELPLMYPPINLQTTFAERVQKIEVQKEAMAASLKELENNFNSLMQRAFKGELV